MTVHPLVPGARIGAFRLARIVARGTTASVWLARHAGELGWAALKLQHAGGGPQTDGRHEYEAARRLGAHPHIARPLDHGLHEGRPWLATEWVPGRDLSHYAQPRWLLPPTRAVHVAWQLAQALAHAHRHGVVHRDLKPANVRIHLPRDLLKLTDFGAAHLDQGEATRSGVLLGTPAYMAPELLRGDPATPAADLYALGVVLFELLSGERPHGGDQLGTLLRRIAQGERTALAERQPELPPAVCELVDALLDPEPARRPAQAGDVARRLRTLLGSWPDARDRGQDARRGELTQP